MSASRQKQSGATDAAPLCLKRNISYIGAFLYCPYKLGQFKTGRGIFFFWWDGTNPRGNLIRIISIHPPRVGWD